MKIIKVVVSIILVFFCLQAYTQNVRHSFANAQITNDGVNDFYEVDVYIQTYSSTLDFKLGSGQLFFTYNPIAFGINVVKNSNFEVSYPTGNGYLCGQEIDAGGDLLYGNFVMNDNLEDRVSFAFSQIYSTSTFVDNNVTNVPIQLCHLKFKYIDSNQAPNVQFYSVYPFYRQFISACDSAISGPNELADCSIGSLITYNDTFDSSGATLSMEINEIGELSFHPNPVNNILFIQGNINIIEEINIFSINGRHIKHINKDFNVINLKTLDASIYFVRIETSNGFQTLKIIKK